jgi:hypothetical protein
MKKRVLRVVLAVVERVEVALAAEQVEVVSAAEQVGAHRLQTVLGWKI